MIADKPAVNEDISSDTVDGQSNHESVVQKGKAIYEQVRAQLDTPENQDKCLIIEVDTGEYEMVADALLARRLHERGPSTRRYLARIGHATFFRFRNRPRKGEQVHLSRLDGELIPAQSGLESSI